MDEKRPIIINAEKNANPLIYNKIETGYSRKLIINRDLAPINPVQCGRQRCPASYSFGPSVRDFWLWHFVISGKGSFTNSRGVFEVGEGSLFVIRPNETTYYKADENDPWSYIWIGFTAEKGLIQIEDTSVIYAPYLEESFVSAFGEGSFENVNTHGAYEHYLCGKIWQILGLIMREKSAPESAYESYVLPAISIMRSEYNTPLTVSEIAERLHVSKGYFFDIFKEHTGIPPKKYLLEIKMKKASELLVSRGLTATATASALGYPDVFAFSRAFKAYFGISPSEFVKKAHSPST